MAMAIRRAQYPLYSENPTLTEKNTDKIGLFRRDSDNILFTMEKLFSEGSGIDFVRVRK